MTLALTGDIIIYNNHHLTYSTKKLPEFSKMQQKICQTLIELTVSAHIQHQL